MTMMNLQKRLVLLSTILSLLSAWSIEQTYRCRVGYGMFFIWVSLTLASSCMLLLFLGIIWLRPSPHHDIKAVLLQLYFASGSYLRGKRLLQQMKTIWQDPEHSQERLLLEILAKNKDTEYSRKYNLGEVTSVNEFRKRHPLIRYDDYRPYVEREMAGERNILTSDLPKDFIVTSGTTGPSKFFVHSDHWLLLTELLDSGFAITRQVCPELGLLQKCLFHYVMPPVSTAVNGAKVHSGMMLRENGVMKYCYTTPPAGYRIGTFSEATYVHLLFALREPHLGAIHTVFSGVVESMMKQLEQSWEDIVDDIEYGTINQKIQLADGVRASLVRELVGGDPGRAHELRLEFEKGFVGIMKRVWPRLAVTMAIDSVGFWTTLQKKYARGVPLVCFTYGCSEGVGLGLAPWFWADRPSIGFSPINVFFEFINIEDIQKKQPRTYLLHELEVDQEYEVVLTQRSGLYRYRLEDVIRISGFHDNCPVFQFQYRIGLMLNVRCEKMDQMTLKTGIKAAIARWTGVELVEYAVAESLLMNETCSGFKKDDIMPYYLVFLEVDSNSQSEISSEQKLMIDGELQARNKYYERFRQDGSISHPRVHIVKPGTFDCLKQHILDTTSTTANQYKLPQKLRTLPMLEFMLGQVAE